MGLTCPSCGEELTPGTQFCPRDGTVVPLPPPTEMLTSGALMPVASPPATPPDAGQPATDALIGRVLDGRYRVRAHLGAGGVGAVYDAEHVEIKKRVAIKVLHAVFGGTEEFTKRFEREAQSASRLSHPSCVSVLDFGRVAKIEPSDGGQQLVGTPYLVMELVSGELLYDRIAKGKLPPAEAIVIARGVLAALKHAHGLGLVHRDVKPANIMLCETGDPTPLVKLLDFGLAKNLAADSADAQQPLTQPGLVFGTPGYLSPEQVGGKPADARSDIYALGVVLFEMVCGSLPFVRADRIEVVRDHLLTPPPPPSRFTPSLSKELEAAILRALEKDPAKRFQRAEELQAALAACPEASGARKGEASRPRPSPDGARKGEASRPRPSPDGARKGEASGARAPSPKDRLLQLLHSHRRAAIAVAGGLLLAVVALALALRSPAPPPAPSLPPPAVAVAPPVSSSARRHLALAEDYQRKLWCSDAVDELERALRDDPQLRASSDVTRIAIPCLRTKTQTKTIRFLVENLGTSAKADLEAALAAEPKGDIRSGLERVLSQLASH